MPQPVIRPKLGAGYWISPNNHFFSVQTHIGSICSTPAAFGTTETALREVFERFGEPWNSEQQARHAIILTLLQYGWICVRNYVESGADRWTINMPAITSENLARVCAFMQLMYPDDVSYAPVWLRSMRGNDSTTVQEILDCRPTLGYLIDPKSLPELIYVTSPGLMPGAGIPEISLDACYPEE